MARAVAAGRVAVGVAALTAPGAAVRLLLGGGRHGEGSALRMFTRMAGIRDLALGLATLDALRRQPHGHRTARLVALSAACDAVDGLATLGAPAVRSRIRPLVGIGALLTAAIGLQQARRLQAQAQSDAPATATA